MKSFYLLPTAGKVFRVLKSALFTPLLLLSVLLFATGGLSGQVTFFTEDFETDGTGTRYVANDQFVDAAGSVSRDYYGRIEDVGGTSTTVGCQTLPLDLENGNYSGQSGSFFFGGEDLNDVNGCGSPNAGSATRNLSISGINVNGASTITARILIAVGSLPTCGSTNSRWDAGEGLKVFYTLDGGTEVQALCFSPDRNCGATTSNTNEPLGLDDNCDGFGDAGLLNNVFSDFNFTIPAGGNTLALRVEIIADAGGEAVAFDNIRLEAVTPPMMDCTTDTTPPVASCGGSIPPTSADANCMDAVANILSSPLVSATDNCDPDPALTQFPSPGTLVPLGENLITITATDASGNSDTCQYFLRVEDNTAPVITCPTEVDSLFVDANCEATVPDFTTPDGTELSNSSTEFSGIQGQDGWTYGRYAAFDTDNFDQLPNFNGFVWNTQGEGNILDFAQLDPNGGHPQFEGLVWAVRRWTSDYDGPVTISGDFYDRDGGCGDGANVRIFVNGNQVYEFLDIPVGAGNAAAYSIDLNVEMGDEIDFAIDPKFDAACDDTHFVATITADNDLTAMDNCGISSITQTPAAGATVMAGTTEIRLIAFDDAGNSDTCMFDLVVADTTSPVLDCSGVVTALDANTSCAALTEGSATIVDNCSPVNVDFTFTGPDGTVLASQAVLPIATGVFDASNLQVPLGTTTLDIIVTDQGGNTDDCSVNIVVSDSSAPTFGMAGALDCGETFEVVTSMDYVYTVEPPTSASSPAQNCWAGIRLRTPQLMDNCGIDSIAITFAAAVGSTPTDLEDTRNLSVGNGDFAAGETDFNLVLPAPSFAFYSSSTGMSATTEVTYTIFDESGNSADCSVFIEVTDDQAPVLTCQADTIVDLDENGMASVDFEGLITSVTDNCGLGDTTAMDLTYECSDIGTFTVSDAVIVFDAANNSDTCDVMVTVRDTTSPVIECQMAIDVELMDTGTDTSFTIFGAFILSDILVSFDDNCAIEPATVGSLPGTQLTFTCDDSGQTFNAGFRFSDGNGNISDCFVEVTVTDPLSLCNAPPVAVCRDFTVDADEDCMAEVVADSLDGGSTDPDGDMLTFTIDPEGPFELGMTTVDLIVSDGQFNDTCEATITVEDNTAPTLECPGVITIFLDENGQDSVTAAEDLAFGFVEMDNCDPTPAGPFYLFPEGEGPPFGGPTARRFDCADIPMTTRRFYVRDDAGNESDTCTVTIMVLDTIAPVVTHPDTTLYLDQNGEAILVVAEMTFDTVENCTVTNVEIFRADEVAMSTFAGGNNFLDEQILFDCDDLDDSPIEILVVATDQSGNMDTTSFLATILDTLPPVIICQDAEVILDAMGMGSITADDLDGGTTDNCDADPELMASMTDFGCDNVGDNMVTLTATDDSGNDTTCVAIVTVRDTTPPVITTTDQTITLNGQGLAQLSIDDLATATDACGVAELFADRELIFDCEDIGDNELLITSIDVNGNEATATVNVEVLFEEPELGCITEINVTLDENCQEELTPQMVLAGNTICLEQFAFDIVVEDNDPSNGPIIDGCGQFTYTIAPAANPGPDEMVLENFEGCWGFVNAEDKTSPVDTMLPTPAAELFCEDISLVNINELPANVSRCWTQSGTSAATLNGSMNPLLRARLIAGGNGTTYV
ncbi:hypothetical protein CEQ90_16970, partial [Lewinellaceae bacterium SD302]